VSKKKRLIIPFYINHKGCPEKCVFCDQSIISGQEDTIPSSDNLETGIVSYLESWQGEGTREVAFYGGTFTALPIEIQERLLAAVRPFIDSGEIDAIRVSTRPDAIDEERIHLLRSYGVATIELGVQSMDDEVLQLSGRGHHSVDTENAARLIKSSELTLGCQLMPGLPGDSYKKSMDSAFKVIELGAEIVRIYPALVISGTEMEKLFFEGSYAPLSMKEALHLCADMVEVFRANSVHIIRVGLQAEKSLGDSLVAGPYHPSFGEMVESSIFMKKAQNLLASCPKLKGDLSLLISPYDESALRGQGNANMKELKEFYPHLKINIKKDCALSRGSLFIQEYNN